MSTEAHDAGTPPLAHDPLVIYRERDDSARWIQREHGETRELCNCDTLCPVHDREVTPDA